MAILGAPTYSLTPSSTKVVQPTNYISSFDFLTQYLPETRAEMDNIYGSQSVTGMLSYLGSESSFASDQFTWTEEGRLHTVYTDVTRLANVFTKTAHVFRLNEWVQVSDANTTVIGIVSAKDANTFTLLSYDAAGWGTLGTTAITAFVAGSEFKKGSDGMTEALESDLTIRTNRPIIQRGFYEVNGSDATQIGWVKVNGGWLWYAKSQMDEGRRFEDKLEISLIVGKQAEAGSDALAAGYGGTEGLFDAIRTRGNLFEGVPSSLTEVDSIVKRMNKQGKLMDYMIYGDEDMVLGLDNLLGGLSDGAAGGVGYGIFKNGQTDALNLGFKGFKRGGYNFHYNNYKLLNDPTLLGAVQAAGGKVRGAMLPIGTKEVYDGVYNGGGAGKKTTVPYIECKYRAAGAENRKNKTMLEGSVLGVTTNGKDTIGIHNLSERMLITYGANNCMLFEGA